MNAVAEGFLPLSRRVGSRPHSDGRFFFREMLPVPLTHHSPCCCLRWWTTHPHHTEGEEEKWGDWSPLTAYFCPLIDAEFQNRSDRRFVVSLSKYLTWNMQGTETEVVMVIVLGTTIENFQGGWSHQLHHIISPELSDYLSAKVVIGTSRSCHGELIKILLSDLPISWENIFCMRLVSFACIQKIYLTEHA